MANCTRCETVIGGKPLKQSLALAEVGVRPPEPLPLARHRQSQYCAARATALFVGGNEELVESGS